MLNPGIAQRLEQYTLKRPGEVLLVHTDIAGEADQVVVFRGFSSSLMRPTAFDPDVPILADNANILSIDRLKGPFIPDQQQYIQQGLTLQAIEALLAEVGV